MSFIPIDAKADVQNSKKGKFTPAQHAQLNAWCLSSKTGILDCGGRCEAINTFISVNQGVANVVLRNGYVVICGRLIQCEDNTIVQITAPPSGTVQGKIILRFNLSGLGLNEFEVFCKTGDLIQQDLNDNPLTGIYEFALYDYTATETNVSLTRNVQYVSDIGGKLEDFITVLSGTGMTGTGNPPLQGYNKSKGTIEERLVPLSNYDNTKGTIETRLTNLGFKTGSVTGWDDSGITLEKLGKFAILRLPMGDPKRIRAGEYVNLTMLVNNTPLISSETLEFALKDTNNRGATISVSEGSNIAKIYCVGGSGESGFIRPFSLGFKIQ